MTHENYIYIRSEHYGNITLYHQERSKRSHVHNIGSNTRENICMAKKKKKTLKTGAEVGCAGVREIWKMLRT